MLPDKKCLHILSKLTENDFQAYIIGESVRDILMQRPVSYFNIASNANIPQITEIFSNEYQISSATECDIIIMDGDGATFKINFFNPIDKNFEAALKERMSHYNFTVNAIAMNVSGNLYDPFGGRSDIDDRLIKYIGDPEICFSENPLLILQTLRLASSLNFNIESKTSEAAKKLHKNLKKLSVDIIRSEFIKILCGINVTEILLEYREIIAVIVPEIRECFDFRQFSRYHKYNVYEHTARAVGNIALNGKNTEILRIAMFFHDIGKPEMFSCDEKGFGHFKGHAQAGAKMAEKIMRRMNFDDQIVYQVFTIIYHHSDHIHTEQQIRNLISVIGHDLFFSLIEAKKADNSAKCEFVASENDELNAAAAIAEKIDLIGN